MILNPWLRSGQSVSRPPSDARRLGASVDYLPIADFPARDLNLSAQLATKIAVTAVLVVLLAGTDGAQALTGGPEIPVNATTADPQIDPAIAPDGSGGFAVAWQGLQDIYARHFGADGAPLTNEIAVNSNTVNEQREPVIAPDGSGGFTVAWRSELQDGSGWGVYARRFDAGGAAVSNEIPVNTTVANDQVEPAIAADPGGGFTVAWASEGQDGPSFGVYARRFDAAGNPLSGEIPVNSITADHQFQPTIASDGSGGFTVAWNSSGQDGSGYGVYARRFDAAGAPLSGEIPVNSTTAGEQLEPAIILEGSGGFTVAWTSGPLSYGPRGVYARRFDLAGAPLSGEIPVTSPVYEPPAITADPGGFTVAWTRYIEPESEFETFDVDVVARRFDAASSSLSGEILINTDTPGEHYDPAITADLGGGFTVAWTAEDDSSYGIYARTFALGPDTQIDAGPSGPTSDATPTFTFSSNDESATFECQVDGAGFSPCSSPFTTNPLSDGPHTFEVRAIDASANPDLIPASRSFTVDTGALDTQIDSGPAGLTNDTTPTFTFSSNQEGSTFECQLDGGSFSPCSSPFTTSPLADSSHTFEVRAIDTAANTDPTPASRTFTVNTVGTDTQIDSGPSPRDPRCQSCWSPVLTANPTPTFTFSSNQEGATFECQLDGGGFSPCSSPLTTGTLIDGPHSFEVKATDGASTTDLSPASRNFTVDTVGPDIWIDSGPPALTNDSTPTFVISSSEPVLISKCRMDVGVTFSTECSSPFTSPPLPDGPHSFDVFGGDAAGNGNPNPPPISVFTVDTVAPNTWIDTGPSGLTEDPSPTFYFSSEPGSTFECQLDDRGYSPCTSPLTTSELSDGPHTIEVRATDAANNPDPSPASRAFTVLPPPIRGETVNVQRVRGIVRIRERRAKRFHRLRVAEQIAVGSLVDTARGRVDLTSATGTSATQTADFYGGGFRVSQPDSGKPTTELELINVPREGQPRRKHKGGGDGLWGNGHGNFSTKGKYGSATVRGTIWFTQDLPEGTFFKVERGIVQVEDFTRDRRILLRPGQDYLAPAR